MPDALAAGVCPPDCEGQIRAIARRLLGSGLDFDDLVSEGRIGAMRAAKNYDPGGPAPFASFARHHIRYAMIDAIRDCGRPIHVPRNLHSPPPEGRTSARHDAARRALGVTFVGDHNLEEGTLDELVVDRHESPREAEMIPGLVADLPPEQSAVIRLLFGLECPSPRSPSEAAADLGLTEESVLGIRDLAFSAMRRRIDDLEFPVEPAPEPAKENAPMKTAPRYNGYTDSSQAGGKKKANSEKEAAGPPPAQTTALMEIGAMNAITSALAGLDDVSRERVVVWVCGVFGVEVGQ